jgi:hypothetical protein
MQWSRLKKMVESRLCLALVGHVQIHTARYTNDEEIGRTWLVLNEQEIFSVGDDPSLSRPAWYYNKGCVYCNASYGRSHLEMFLLPYLNLSIDEALTSPHEFDRALAMFDNRIGKRRLKDIAHRE